MGESGSGKTTLARTLLGLERPVSGQVVLDERGAAEAGARPVGCGHCRRRVQMVLQDPSGALNPRQTVYESVAEGLRLHDIVSRDPERRTEAQLVAAAMGVSRPASAGEACSCATRTSCRAASGSGS